ncbi:imidazolonepropionase [Bacillus mangrovi]|uniref:Imidazolonepropionase n=1 Tax=Metabacillus mangrovi TaxID=1491830 RepID=A0A7X2S2C1_9BACI|nr:imidazolonepropionase [Metabacillus mangrovi]MTH51908.1 imidazolonepropionase [Metabacillus mangrovi]
MNDLLIYNIGQLLLPLSAGVPLKGNEMSRLPVLEHAAFAVKDGNVSWIGPSNEGIHAAEKVDAGGKVVSPGLIDPHTHLVFAGSREDELALKQAGTAYLDILKSGGGILSTVSSTRKASEEELFKKAEFHLMRMLSHGVTALEAKSGYGLDRETELRQLRIARKLQETHHIRIASTFLGPHAVPADRKGKEEEFLKEMTDLLTEIKEEGLADFADIFCETGVFTAEQCSKFLLAAKSAGLKLKIHADEIHSTGGTELAVSLGAQTADHLVAVSEEGISMLAASETVAVLLPGTTFYLGKERYAPARRLIEEGAAVALATDFNPGSCVTENLQLIMSLAALKLRMSAEEIWNAVTVNAAHAAGFGEEAGTLKVGGRADFTIWNIPNYRYLPYHFGVNHTDSVYIAGEKRWEGERHAGLFLSETR